MKVNVIRGFRPNATDSKSVELRFMSVRVGLGVPLKINLSDEFNISIRLEIISIPVDNFHQKCIV